MKVSLEVHIVRTTLSTGDFLSYSIESPLGSQIKKYDDLSESVARIKSESFVEGMSMIFEGDVVVETHYESD